MITFQNMFLYKNLRFIKLDQNLFDVSGATITDLVTLLFWLSYKQTKLGWAYRKPPIMLEKYNVTICVRNINKINENNSTNLENKRKTTTIYTMKTYVSVEIHDSCNDISEVPSSRTFPNPTRCSSRITYPRTFYILQDYKKNVFKK